MLLMTYRYHRFIETVQCTFCISRTFVDVAVHRFKCRENSRYVIFSVVKLFNAVSKHQKEMESRLKEAPTEAKKSKGRKRNRLVMELFGPVVKNPWPRNLASCKGKCRSSLEGKRTLITDIED